MQVITLEHKVVDKIGANVKYLLRSTILYPGSHLVSFEKRPTHR